MRVSVVIDSIDPAALVEFWSAALAYRAVPSPPGYAVLKPSDGEPEGPVLILQQVPERKRGKNRVHLDVHAPHVPTLVNRLEALGGRRLGRPVTELLDRYGVWWQVVSDPEGNELCVVADAGHPPPE